MAKRSKELYDTKIALDRYEKGDLVWCLGESRKTGVMPKLDKSVQSSIPNYFKNCEVPIICYKYNKPIRGAIFNFNKLVSDLDIETCTPDS